TILILFLSNYSHSDTVKLNQFELSGVVLNSKNSLAVLFDTNHDRERILRIGDMIGQCVLDFIQKNGASFYCDNQVYTLTLRGLSLELAPLESETVWSSPMLISKEDQGLLFDEPSNFVSEFNLTPYTKEGKFAAFEVKTMPDESLSARYDLLEGDLIVGINGVPATNIEEFSKAFDQIRFTQTVDIELIRDGVRHHKSYMLNRSIAESN
ncbi:MAG: hypothetical protein AAF372_05370, partial [Pseudomonadota bacterium]